MANVLVPELAVRSCTTSKRFYCDVLGFTCEYERAEEGFAYLSRDGAEIMLDQVDMGRTFDDGYGPDSYPFGRGVNLQIEVSDILDLAEALQRADIALYLELEDKWYRNAAQEHGNRQFIVADPDGYLLRFYQSLGVRSVIKPQKSVT